MEGHSPESSSGGGAGTVPTAVAIDRDKNSQHAVRWAIDNLRFRDKKIILVHVCTQQNLHPQDGEARGPTQAEMQQMFLPYRGFCARKGIRTEEVILHDLDIAHALSEYISANSIKTIVLGASSRSAIARAFRNADVPTSVGKYAPDSCSVYAVSKGKAIKIKSASEPVTPISVPDNPFSPDRIPTNSPKQGSWRSEVSSSEGGFTASRRSLDGIKNAFSPVGNTTPSPPNSVSSNESLHNHMFPWEKNRRVSPESTQFGGSSFDLQDNSRSGDGEFVQGAAAAAANSKRPQGGKVYALQQSVNFMNLRGRTLESFSQYSSGSSEHSELQSFQSDLSYDLLDQPRISDSSRSSTSSAAELEEELKRMKLELKQITEKYNAACQEAVTAREKVRDIVQWKSEEASKLAESKHAQEAAMAIVDKEKQKCKAAVGIAQKAQRLAELESEKRKRAERKFKKESEEKHKAMDALARSIVRYRMYSIDEIEVSTDYFSSSNMIGEGSYGPVYRATIDHTPVAVKVLRSEISEGLKQFNIEIEVLSRMRHPNMVILLGACPEYGCLVYEYMENGSLEDRLFRKDGTPPLPWSTRFKIAAEIATALNFLHQTRPEPLVHRDLKPANILLDKNYVSKIGDVGLSRLVPPSAADAVTQYRMTAAAGTFCYIDPEYQQTAMLGTKSDVYSLGVVLLQIITAKPPMGLAHLVERAIETGRFADVLDPAVRDWPVDEALAFASLALSCCELRRRDRPDLDTVVLPRLERLRDVGFQVQPEGMFYYMYSKGQSFQECSSSSSQETRNNSETPTGNYSSTITTNTDSSTRDRNETT
ncbi:hypothetical protein ACP275_04G095800 [Erythranthe tilingii]